jgi:hypothetical protein
MPKNTQATKSKKNLKSLLEANTLQRQVITNYYLYPIGPKNNLQ